MSAVQPAASEKLDHITVDRRERPSGYVMRSHHCHPYFELVCIEHGSCRFLIEDNMYDLQEGDFLLIPPQLLHYTHYRSGPCRRCSVYFNREEVHHEVVALLPEGEAFFTKLHIFQAPPGCREFAPILAAMAAEEQLGDERSILMKRLRLQELLLLASRICSFLPDAPADIHTTDRQILLAAHFINDHFRQQISAADIAAAVGFSPNYLSRKFREAAGIGVHEYLVFIRLRNAAYELAATDMSVTQIALHCGFSDSNYFKDVFKKKYGMTPREYRKSNRAPQN